MSDGNDKLWGYLSIDNAVSEREHEAGERQYRDEEWLREQYVERGLSVQEMVEECSAAETTIQEQLRESSIELRESSGQQIWSDDEIVAAVCAVWRSVGRRPSVPEYREWRWRSEDEQPCAQTVRARLGDGSWPKAMDVVSNEMREGDG